MAGGAVGIWQCACSAFERLIMRLSIMTNWAVPRSSRHDRVNWSKAVTYNKLLGVY